jgi:hypothetical protein
MVGAIRFNLKQLFFKTKYKVKYYQYTCTDNFFFFDVVGIMSSFGRFLALLAFASTTKHIQEFRYLILN